MPISQKVKSPPGVKTRVRRSSIYLKGGAQLTSPPSSRTRRRSMYVSGKAGLPPMAEFSKVWATPAKPVEPLVESPELIKQSPVKSSRKVKKDDMSTTPQRKTPAAKAGTKKTPKSPARNRSKTPVKAKATTPTAVETQTESKVKTPAKSKAKTPAKSKVKTPAQSKSETPAKSKAKTPAKPKAKTPAQSKTDTPAKPKAKTPAKSKAKTPAKNSSDLNKKTPELVKQTPVQRASASKAENTPKAQITKSAVKSQARKPKSVKNPVPLTPQKNSADTVITSTPSKSLKDITGKSFYSTPSETPIPMQRTDDVFVFSAQPAKSAKKSAKRATILSPKITPHKRSMKTPKKTPLRKTPAAKKRALDDSAFSTPSAKRSKTSPEVKKMRSTKKIAKNPPSPQSPSPVSKAVLTPSEMTSILKDVVETEKLEERKASLSPSPRPRKLAKLASDVAQISTPRVIKTAKRAGTKKLAEIQDINNSSGMEWSNVSLLDDTINTDSRSGRCIIL